jgi:hypothetical protein
MVNTFISAVLGEYNRNIVLLGGPSCSSQFQAGSYCSFFVAWLLCAIRGSELLGFGTLSSVQYSKKQKTNIMET